jgi:hypothetical protein
MVTKAPRFKPRHTQPRRGSQPPIEKIIRMTHRRPVTRRPCRWRGPGQSGAHFPVVVVTCVCEAGITAFCREVWPEWGRNI